MTQITMILGSIALFVAGFLTLCTLRHRRVAAAFKRVPVGHDRNVRVLRRDIPEDTL